MYKKLIKSHEVQMIEAIKRLVAIESVRDEKTKQENAPFGKGIKDAMDEFMRIAKNLGFEVRNHEGYVVSAQLGKTTEHVGVLAHLDVVSALEDDWDTPPFELSILDGRMFGRGVNDDKGPLIAALFAAYFVGMNHELSNRSIRLIVGGAEETTWECMDHYFKKEAQPVWGFSPDGNFPIVNGEMGILQLGLRFDGSSARKFVSEPRTNYLCHELSVDGEYYKGDRHLSRNPQRGLNAIDAYFDKVGFGDSPLDRFIQNCLHHDYQGKGLSIAGGHSSMNDVSVCMMSLNSVGNQTELCLDIRYPINVSESALLSTMHKHAQDYGFEIEILRSMAPLFVDENSELVLSLQSAYETVMERPAEVLTKGGASYARVLDRGLAFGATFEGEDPRPHMSNENMAVDSLLKACEIYCIALEKLV